MPRFLFQVHNARFARPIAIEDVLGDSFAARQTALGICADLAKDILSGLEKDSEWRMEVLNESGKPVFRIRILAESLDHPVTESGSPNASDQGHGARP